MFEFEVTSEFLTILVAGALAILFDYFPWIAKWFDGQKESTKKLLNVGLLVVSAGVLFGGDCAGWFVTNLVCTTKGFFDTLYIVFLALGVNYVMVLPLILIALYLGRSESRQRAAQSIPDATV